MLLHLARLHGLSLLQFMASSGPVSGGPSAFPLAALPSLSLLSRGCPFLPPLSYLSSSASMEAVEQPQPTEHRRWARVAAWRSDHAEWARVTSSHHKMPPFVKVVARENGQGKMALILRLHPWLMVAQGSNKFLSLPRL